MNAWESFLDVSYFSLWAVRPVGDGDFNSALLFHFVEKGCAETFKDRLNSYSTFEESLESLSKDALPM